MPVPSTPTANDKHKERRIISDDIARLKVEKEHLEREVNTLIVSREDLIKKSGLAPQDYKKVEDGHLVRMQSIETQTLSTNIAVKKANDELREIRLNLTQVSEALASAEKRLEELTGQITRAEEAATKAEANKRVHEKAFADIIADDELRLKNIRLDYDEVAQLHISMTTELNARHAEIMEEERLLAIRRDDIEVLEERFRKRYPNQAITL